MKSPEFRLIPNIIDDVVIVNLDTFHDHRGMNYEGYNEELYSQHPSFKNLKFKVDAFSRSQKNVLRGFHGDTFNYKLIQCLAGTVKFYLLDYRPKSKTYKNTQLYILDGDNPYQILLPPGVLNAHLCLSEECLFSYKVSDRYATQKEQLHVKWNDPRFKLNWGKVKPILSDRDK